MKNQARSVSLAAVAVGLATMGVPAALKAVDVVHADDVIIEGSLCVSDGNACASGESFSSDADIKVKDSLPVIVFEDTSLSSSPDRDYRLVVGDAFTGGAEYFAIEDRGANGSGSTKVFRVDGGAPASALRIDSSGDVGMGTATPAKELHVLDSNAPTLRLDQDGSIFPAQAWDIVGSDLGFRVIDRTNSSLTPFQIRPNSPNHSLYIEDTGAIGLGTNSPDQVFHIKHTGHILPLFETTDGGAIQMRMKSSSSNRRFVALNGANVVQSQIVFGDNGRFDFLGQTVADVRMSIDAAGNLTVPGTCRDGNGGGGGADGCDAVFDPSYELPSIEEHAAYMWRHKHLPAVGPTPEDKRIHLSVQQRHFAVLNELEKAHIYIEQLHEEAKQKDERIAALETGAAASANALQDMLGRVAALESR